MELTNSRALPFFTVIFATLGIFLLSWPSSSVFAQSSSDSDYKPTCPTPLKKLLGNDVSCSKLECITSLTEADCREGETYEENVAQCGCCPGCVKREVRNPGEECMTTYFKRPTTQENRTFWPIIKIDCTKETYCSSATGLCEPVPTTSMSLTCAQMRGLFNTVDENKVRRFHWEPTCNPDGSFAPVQCKGTASYSDAMCYCSTPEGKRIFGKSKYLPDTRKNMTCGCSLHVYRLREEKKLVTSIHCSADGNYEPLQCDGNSGLCYCVDEKTGKLQGDVLPEQHWKNLPCYDSKTMTGTYYRQCDSAWVANEKIREEARQHGLDSNVYTSLKTYRCDYDGSFSAFQIRGADEICAGKRGTQIQGFFRSSSSAKPMSCYCARDKTEEGVEWPSYRGDCVEQGDVGGYQPVSTEGDGAFCLDRDGFVFNTVDIQYKCCLEESKENCPPTLDDQKCRDAGIRKCSEVPTGSPGFYD